MLGGLKYESLLYVYTVHMDEAGLFNVNSDDGYMGMVDD